MLQYLKALHRINNISLGPRVGPLFPFLGFRFPYKVLETKKGTLFIPRFLLGLLVVRTGIMNMTSIKRNIRRRSIQCSKLQGQQARAGIHNSSSQSDRNNNTHHERDQGQRQQQQHTITSESSAIIGNDAAIVTLHRHTIFRQFLDPDPEAQSPDTFHTLQPWIGHKAVTQNSRP